MSLHTGKQYSKIKSGEFDSWSNENNHKARAIVAALDQTIKDLVEDGFRK